MSTTHEQEIAILTDKLNALENESRRILRALNWASKVRLILVGCLILFVLATTFLFYTLYLDIKNNRIAKVQQLINEKPEEFSAPLTKQIMLLAEEQGPVVAEAFRKQAQQDSQLYVDAFDQERNVLINNLQDKLETKLTQTYAELLDNQEAMLREEFPVLKNPENMANIRNNMEKVYDKIGQRYYVEYLKDELESIAEKLDTFPPSSPRQESIPIGEQIASEFLELVRLMLVNSDHYVIPEEESELALVTSTTDVEPGPESSTSDETEEPSAEESDADSGDKGDEKVDGEDKDEDNGKDETDEDATSDETDEDATSDKTDDSDDDKDETTSDDDSDEDSENESDKEDSSEADQNDG